MGWIHQANSSLFILLLSQSALCYLHILFAMTLLAIIEKKNKNKNHSSVLWYLTIQFILSFLGKWFLPFQSFIFWKLFHILSLYDTILFLLFFWRFIKHREVDCFRKGYTRVYTMSLLGFEYFFQLHSTCLLLCIDKSWDRNTLIQQLNFCWVFPTQNKIKSFL